MMPEEFFIELENALNEYRFADIGKLSNLIIPMEFTDKQVRKALNLIRRKRLFSDLEKCAGLFFMAGNQQPVVYRQYAQALLDQNRVAQILPMLLAMAPGLKDDDPEGPEVQGLIGRAYKQLYVNDPGHDKENLIKAIEAYRPGWYDRKGDYRWHGINLVALLERAKRDNIDPQLSDKAPDIARKILEEIDNLEQKMLWDYGTAMEASVALRDYKSALKWAKEYVNHPDADAFELAGTLRQFKEIWQLEENEEGRKLIPILEYELLQREGGLLDLTSTVVSDKRVFEAVYGDQGYTNVEWLENVYKCCKSVARVIETGSCNAKGTGFVIKGSDLNKKWGDQPVLMTNAHVISENPADEAPLTPVNSSVEFTKHSSRTKIELGELLYSSPKIEFDVSILRLKVLKGIKPLIPSFHPPRLPQQGEKPELIYVIGHPHGGEMAISLYNNNLLGFDKERYVHYRSPTDNGSSGSPVLTRLLKPFAIHHSTKPELQANEGVLLEPIKKAIST